MYTNLQSSGVGYCFEFPVTVPEGSKTYVELLLVYYYNISQQVRIIFSSHRGTEEKVMGIEEFIDGLYRIEKHRVEQEVFAKEEIREATLKSKPKRMLRLEKLCTG